MLAKGLREQIEAAGSTCEQELDKAIKDADDFDLEVDDVTIDGDQATAKVKGRPTARISVRDVHVRQGRRGLARDGSGVDVTSPKANARNERFAWQAKSPIPALPYWRS